MFDVPSVKKATFVPWGEPVRRTRRDEAGCEQHDHKNQNKIMEN